MKLKQRNEEKFERRIKEKEREEEEIQRQRDQQAKIRKQRAKLKMSRMKDIQKQRNTDFHHIKGKRIKDEKDRKLFKDMIVE